MSVQPRLNLQLRIRYDGDPPLDSGMWIAGKLGLAIEPVFRLRDVWAVALWYDPDEHGNEISPDELLIRIPLLENSFASAEIGGLLEQATLLEAAFYVKTRFFESKLASKLEIKREFEIELDE